MTGRVRRTTGNISAVKRGPNRLGPSMDRTLRCATPRQVEDTHCGRVVGVSHSPLSVLTSLLQDQDQEPGEDGRTVQRYSLWFRAFSVGANCGGFHSSQSEHAVGQPGCMSGMYVLCSVPQYYGRFSSNPIQRVPGSLGPWVPIASPSLPCGCYSVGHVGIPKCLPPPDLAAHMQCSSAAVQKNAVAIYRGRRDS